MTSRMVTFHLVFVSLLSVSLAAYSIKSKKGTCPVNTGVTGICSDCTNDYDCPGRKKCCSSQIGSCATYCVLPVLGVGSSSFLNRRTSLDGIDGLGADTIGVVSFRRVIKTGGGGKGVLRSGGIDVDGFIGGGSRRVIDNIGRGSQISGHLDRKLGGVVGDIDGGLTRGGSRRVIETVGGHGVEKLGGVVGGSIDGSLIGGGSRRVVETVGVGSGLGRGGKRITHTKEISRSSTVIDGGIRGGSGCRRECDDHIDCGHGYICIHSGCGSTCEIEIIDGGVGVGGAIGVSGHGILEKVKGVPTDGRIDVIDAISGGRGGVVGGVGGIDRVDGFDTISGRTAVIGGVGTSVIGDGCRKQCHSDADCLGNKYCVTVGCNMICRTSKVIRNDYTR